MARSRIVGQLVSLLCLAPPVAAQAPAPPTVASAPSAPAAAPEVPAAVPPTDATPSAPPPAPVAPAAAAPASPAPTPPPAAAALPPAPPRLDSALVHLAADYPRVVLELRSFVDSGDWKVACSVPCDRVLVTLGSEARVSAPGMSTSNVFRIDPGPGVALVKVNGGSSTLRTLGIAGLGIGIPFGLAGTAMYSYGKYKDSDGLAVSGGVVLGLGAVMILAAIPMLLSSTTNVRDGKGTLIAGVAPEPTTN